MDRRMDTCSYRVGSLRHKSDAAQYYVRWKYGYFFLVLIWFLKYLTLVGHKINELVHRAINQSVGHAVGWLVG